MLDKGFENDIRNIISSTKQGSDRQTLMCMLLSFGSCPCSPRWNMCSQRDMAGFGAAASKHVPARPGAGDGRER
jgi:hypothetical protein